MKKGMQIKKGSVVLNINSKIYPLEVIYSAAYVFLDRAYVMLDGNPKKKIIVNLEPKGKDDLKKMKGEFLNELINYADYNKMAKQTAKTREMIMQRALITNDPSAIAQKDDEEFEKLLKDIDNDEDFLDDPEGIAIPWEEKYGKKVKKKKSKKKKR